MTPYLLIRDKLENTVLTVWAREGKGGRCLDLQLNEALTLRDYRYWMAELEHRLSGQYHEEARTELLRLLCQAFASTRMKHTVRVKSFDGSVGPCGWQQALHSLARNP